MLLGDKCHVNRLTYANDLKSATTLRHFDVKLRSLVGVNLIDAEKVIRG